MSLEKIVEEALAGRPLEMKEAFAEVIQARVLAALEEKYKKMAMESDDEDDEDEDEDEDDEDEDDEDMDESLDLSDYTLEELEDFMVSEDFDQLDELDKKTLASYVKKASYNAASNAAKFGAGETDKFTKAHKRLGGIAKATDRLAK